ncbi:MAG: GDP-mannose 4,6-dehydratase [bacterium]|nr:GDP-mannose 4,6-dehydratase [bacterium]
MMLQNDLHRVFGGRQVLITGGLGFLGSNLAIRLAQMGASVTLLDSMLPLYGGNLFNVESVKHDVHINFSDIRDRHSMNYVVQDKDYVFHLAGQVSHVDSILDPFTDVDINISGTLSVLEACRLFNAKAKIIFTGTRGQYGASVKLPVDETAPTNPKGIYAITNLAAEQIIMMYHEIHELQGICLRITNTYGPCHHMKHNRYGVANWFVRLALDGQTIPIMGDGRILRDFLYVDDLVDALLLASASESAYGHIFNVGSGVPTDFITLGDTIVRLAGSGCCKKVPFSEERKQLEPGDYYADISKIRTMLGWEPKTSLEEGLKRTIAFYRQYRHHYWNEASVDEESAP